MSAEASPLEIGFDGAAAPREIPAALLEKGGSRGKRGR
jgi:hypothetical protein